MKHLNSSLHPTKAVWFCMGLMVVLALAVHAHDCGAPKADGEGCDAAVTCGAEAKACGSEAKACGTEAKACGTEAKACGTEAKACGGNETDAACDRAEKTVRADCSDCKGCTATAQAETPRRGWFRWFRR